MPWLTGFGRGRRETAEFSNLLQQLVTAKTALEDTAEGLEAQFLTTSSELEKLAQYGDRFVGEVETLIGQASGKSRDGAIFDHAIQLIEQTTTFLAGCEKETSEMVQLLRTYQEQIEDLLRVETSLRHAMLPLNIVQTLFRMESAPLGLEVQQLFGALTQEIEILHGRMRDIFGTKFHQLEETRQTIGLVISKLDFQTASLRQVASTRKAQIESSLTILRQEMLNNEDRDVHIHRLSQALSREVGRVVTGLQFQDIVNQKLQHVLAALPQITARLEAFKSGASPAAANESLQFVRQSCRLEAGQVQLARQELAEAEAAIRTGIEKVLKDLTELDSQSLSLDEFKLLTTSFDGIVKVLVDTIEEVRTLVAATVTNAAEAYELLRPLGGLASDLTAVIRSVSGQMHLIGLNAQVKAVQVSQHCRGQGLEVLSARTSEISQETSRLSEQAAAQLDAMVAGLTESVKAFERLQARGHEQQAHLNEQGRKYEQQLREIRDGSVKTLQIIGASLKEISRQAGVALQSIKFKSFHEVTLPALQAPLLALSSAAEQSLLRRGQGLAGNVLVEGFKRDYTMASERKVFAGVVTSGSQGGAASVTAADASPCAALLPELPAVPSPAASLPLPPPAPVIAGLTAPVDLGGNVELF